MEGDGDVAPLAGIAGVGGRHGDLDHGGIHRHFDDDGVLVEIDFVAAAIGAAQDGEHAPLPEIRMTTAITAIAASLPPSAVRGPRNRARSGPGLMAWFSIRRICVRPVP